MKRLFFIILLCSTMFTSNIFGQELFNDQKLSVTSDILKYEDQKNDQFYNYYNFTIKNIGSEKQKFELIINYNQNGKDKSSQSLDESLIFELAPEETIVGDINNKRILTLFKSFLPGNSGKKASDSFVVIKSIEINYL